MVLRRRDGRGCQQWYYVVGMARVSAVVLRRRDGKGVSSGITT